MALIVASREHGIWRIQKREGDGSTAPGRPHLIDVCVLAADQFRTLITASSHMRPKQLLFAGVGLDTRTIALAANSANARIEL